MYISGIQVENKKSSLKIKSNSRPKPVSIDPAERPYSSEYKQLYDQDEKKLTIKKTTNPIKKKEYEQARNLSQNKMIFRRNYSEKTEDDKTRQPQTQGTKGRASEKDKNSEKVLQMQEAYFKGKEKQREKKGGHAQTKSASIPVKNGTVSLGEQEIMKVQTYFRYLPVSILGVCGFKQIFMKELIDRKDFHPINPYKKPHSKKQLGQLLAKLSKNSNLKGKYRYRQKFNYAYCAQLKALEYKRREYKKKKESSSSDSDDDKKQKCRDFDTWKKSMGVKEKVFIIKGKYPDLRDALLERGWVENTDKKSTFYDFRWTTKISDVNFETLKAGQIVNHFDNNACLTSKYGIIKSLRSVMCPQSMDTDKFFPKAYDLSDLSDFQNFIEMYKWTYCESLLKKYLMRNEQIPQNYVKLAIIVTERRLLTLENVISSLPLNKYNFCTNNQWKFFQKQPCNEEQIAKSISPIFGDKLEEIVNDILGRLKKKQPQYDLNGYQNIWIVKPAYLSRGRGIKCLSNLNDILDASLGKENQYVVQKYIENPLIINRRKFDIRIWVVIEDYNPPKIWFYNQFYVRFCLEDYDTKKLKNKYCHLTNNSIQKYNAKVGKVDLDDSMWDRQKFENYIKEGYGVEAFKDLIGKMKEIVVATILGTVDQVHGRKGSFEQIGYDMMIDDQLNPWLIEINSSPAMDYSTPITRKLVRMVMQDIATIVVDYRKKKNKPNKAGEFKNLYSGGPWKHKFYNIDSDH